MTDSIDPNGALASAALDNEVTAAERAQVDASPALTAEMAGYRALRADLADVEVPAAARESAISAALATFDSMGQRVGEGDGALEDGLEKSAEVVSLHSRRQRQYRWVGGIAAAVIVAVVGIVVINSNRTDSKRFSADTATVPQVESAFPSEKSTGDASTEAATEPAIGAAGGGAADSSATTTAADGAADSRTSDTSTSDTSTSDTSTSGTSTADTTAGTTATATGETAAANDTVGGAASVPILASSNAPTAAANIDPWTDAPTFSGPADLAAFAFAVGSPLAEPSTAASPPSSQPATATTTSIATAATSAPSTSAAPVGSVLLAEALCDTAGRPTLAAIYMGERVLIVRDDPTHELQIIEPATCSITSTIAIP